MKHIGRNEDSLTNLRTLHLAFNLYLYLSLSKDHKFIGHVNKVSPYSSRRITEDSKAVASFVPVFFIWSGFIDIKNFDLR